jgi:hypothetical protein
VSVVGVDTLNIFARIDTKNNEIEVQSAYDVRETDESIPYKYALVVQSFLLTSCITNLPDPK